MIPPSTSRPFGRPSPRLSEVDLAKIITRTIQMAVDAKRELGFAAVSTGCDGRQRTTFFDGSSCQTEGAEVCIAERQDGITACLQVQMQGSGIDFRSISFKPAPCSPVTGWYILDDRGFLYRIPSGLLTPVPYWPPVATWDPAGFDLVRSGSWAKLMCAAALVDPTLHGDGASAITYVAVNTEEAVWAQVYSAAVGGRLTHFETVPSLTPSSGNVSAGALSGRWRGVYRSKGTPTSITLSQYDVNTNALEPGQEYKATIYAKPYASASIQVDIRKGVRAAAGEATAPAVATPGTDLPVGIATVAYGGTVTVESTASTTPYEWAGLRTCGAGPYEAKWRQKAVLVRDSIAPNAGARWLDVTLPSADSGVVSGAVRVAFGYPLALTMVSEHINEGAPFATTGSAALAARPDWDMAIVYPEALAVEYAPYHLNLAGGDILAPDDSSNLAAVDVPAGAHDVAANIIQFPNGEIGLSRPLTVGGTPVVPQRFERYRVRPAPSEPLTVAVSQLALGTWPDDPNAWESAKEHLVNAWLEGATTFTLATGSWTHGRAVPCVVWQYAGPGGLRNHWSNDPTARYGVLQQPAGGTCEVAFGGGGGAQAPIGGTVPKVTILGPRLVAAYGWTFKLGGIESALSPLTETVELVPATSTYTITLTVPLGPAGTTERSIYRFAYDFDGGIVGGVQQSPWDSRVQAIGAVYDRMCVWIGTIDDNSTTEWADEETTLTFAGLRPPVPFLGPVGSGVTLDIPGARVQALAPLNL